MSIVFTVVAFVIGVLVGREKFSFIEGTVEKVSTKMKQLLDKASK